MTAGPVPSISRDVHYVSHGTPPGPDGTQAFESRCCAAKITEVAGDDSGVVGLVVFNPGGLFFAPLAAGGSGHDQDGHAGGSWHWPERVGP
jgi:hypothetical protein